ncbi:MAG: sensor domain-containing phosphodiesterase [Rhodocyclaceae bacterium]|nr:sensor domain-containing phosphodiesterase [Rhodocyclaceae bacterium]
MELAPVPRDPDERFAPDLSEGAEAGLYLSLFELMNEGLIITSDETILEVNSAVCRLMERNYCELAGQPLASLFPSERAFLSARAALFIQGEMRGSLRIKLPGGRERDLAYVAAARIRPGVHALILSPDPVTGGIPAKARAADTVWPRLAAALDQPALVLDARDRIMAANAPARQRFGVTESALTGQPLATVCSLADGARDTGPVTVTPADGSPRLHGRLIVGPEPGWRILLLSGAAPMTPVDARPGRVFRHHPQPMLVVRGDDLRIVAANEAAARAHGQPRQALVDRPLSELREAGASSAPLDPGVWHWRDAARGFRAQTLVEPLDGAHNEWLLIYDSPQQPWPASNARSTPTDTDPLTGLPGRHTLHARFEAIAAAPAPLGLVSIDVDGLGSGPEGDALLLAIAQRLNLGIAGAQLARVGHQRFLALINGLATVNEVVRAAEQLRAALSRPFRVRTDEVALNAYLGVALFPQDAADFDTLATQADHAMLAARLDATGRCHFHADALNTASLEGMALERALAGALKRRALTMVFQPVADADSGDIVAAEAFVRWPHPELGLLKPGQFMPVAQHAGLEESLGFLALEMACQHAAEWHQAGVKIPVAIHASAAMLAHPQMVARLRATLAEAGLSPAAIELNLPESALLAPSDAVRRTLTAIDQLGARLAVTGVGRHALPISRLQSLPIHTLKLDRALVRDALDAGAQAVLDATLAAARCLGLAVQAVGIETAAHADVLLSRGCTRQQGQFYAAPLPADDFAQLL